MNYPAAFTPAMIETFQQRALFEVVAWHAAGRYVYAVCMDPAGRFVLLTQDGGTYQAPKAHDSMTLAKLIARRLDDDALRPELVGVIGARWLDDLAILPAPAAVEVGQLVWTQGTGRLRRGVVTKIGRSRVEVAYTTASSAGRIYRTSTPIDALRVDSERARIPAAAPAVEVEAPAGVVGDDDTAPHMCEPCARAGVEVEAVDLDDVPGADRAEAVCASHRIPAGQLTTVRSRAALDAADGVLCTIGDLDLALAKLADVAEADVDARLRASILDLLAAMHSVHSTLATDVSIYVRAAGIEL